MCFPIRVHYKLHPKDCLLACDNKLYSFFGTNIFYSGVLFLAHFFDDDVPVRCVVELLAYLLRGLELFEVRGEVHFLLFEVEEVLIGLSQSFDWFLTPPVVEVNVLEQLSQRQPVLLLVCCLELWVFGECSLHFLIYLSILFGVC